MPPPAQTTDDAAAALLEEAVALSERALEQVLPGASAAPARLHQAMRYSVFAGGKRLRPALVLSAYRYAWASMGRPGPAAEDGRRLLHALAAVELLHTYTLIHDDLPAMDDDDLRRGRPTCHRAFDEATAILAGDALQCLAFGVAAEVAPGAVQLLAAAAGSLGVVGGQQDDCDATARWQRAGDGTAVEPALIATLERIHRRKTAALIAASCQLGALAADADAALCARIGRFGEAIGLAFQIADDILDATASSQALGKTAGKDAAQGKLTYVALFGLEAARRHASTREAEALAALADAAPHADGLLALARFMVRRGH
jgi:geranylgeranyl pyrophosphate synthase